MRPRKKSLLIHFALIFTIFSIVVLIICGVSTYANQTRIYKDQLTRNMQGIGDFICRMMQEDGVEFVAMQDYILEHTDDLRIPEDISGWEEKEAEFFTRFHNEFPGRTLEVDMDYDELPDDLRVLCTTYNYQYWMNMIFDAMDEFDIEYAYYVTPIGREFDITYILDIVPATFEENGINYRVLGDHYPQPVSEHQALWKTWDSGEAQDIFDVYDNEYGHTYAYYAPLIIDGEKIGMVGAEVTVDNVNSQILRNTLLQIVYIGLILLVSMALLLFIINRRYIRKIENLSTNVRRYTESKDADISGEIENDAKGNDEITALANQTAAMILELDNYMKNLVSTTQELSETKEHAQQMSELATRDALTGIRNKAAYDIEMKNLEWKMNSGLKEFGIAMVDLNFLKRINDTYGHERGNIAIKTICSKVCEIFAHSPVFRIGGDEFVIILTGHDFEHVDELIEKFNSDLDALMHRKDLEPWEAVSAAIGFARYDETRDGSPVNVFKRADDAMYERKRQMHATRE